MKQSSISSFFQTSIVLPRLSKRDSIDSTSEASPASGGLLKRLKKDTQRVEEEPVVEHAPLVRTAGVQCKSFPGLHNVLLQRECGRHRGLPFRDHLFGCSMQDLVPVYGDSCIEVAREPYWIRSSDDVIAWGGQSGVVCGLDTSMFLEYARCPFRLDKDEDGVTWEELCSRGRSCLWSRNYTERWSGDGCFIGEHLMVASACGAIICVSARDGSVVETAATCGSSVWSLDWNSSSPHLVCTSGKSGLVSLLDINRMCSVGIFGRHKGASKSVRFGCDGHLLWSCGMDGHLVAWDHRQGGEKSAHRFSGCGRLCGLAITTKGDVVSATTNTITHWDVRMEGESWRRSIDGGRMVRPVVWGCDRIVLPLERGMEVIRQSDGESIGGGHQPFGMRVAHATVLRDEPTMLVIALQDGSVVAMNTSSGNNFDY